MKRLFLLLATFGLLATACESNQAGDQNGDGSIGEKKLVKMVEEGNGSESYSYNFSYDNQGKLMLCTAKFAREGKTYIDGIYLYEWSANAISCEYEDEYTAEAYGVPYIVKTMITYTYTLNNNGLVQMCDELNTTSHYASSGQNQSQRQYIYVYDVLGRPIEEKSSDKSFTSCRYFSWSGDKLSFGDYGGKYDTFTYEGHVCRKGYNPRIAACVVADSPLAVAHPELFGVRTMQLPATITSVYSTTEDTVTNVTEYSYEMDNDGYITKITGTGEDGYSYSYTLTWE